MNRKTELLKEREREMLKVRQNIIVGNKTMVVGGARISEAPLKPEDDPESRLSVFLLCHIIAL